MEKLCNGCFKKYDDKFDLCPYCGYYPGAPAKEAYHLAPGTVIGDRYRLGNVIGFGGFGITYKAWDTQLDTLVAIKEYYPVGAVNRTPDSSKLIFLSDRGRREFEMGLERFIDEARNMAQFNSHPNIVNVYGYIEENNTAYIVMEYLDGSTLGDYMRENGEKLAVDKSVKIVLGIINALKEAHKHNIIHRDISPDNIFLCNNGDIKLIDFGAARFTADNTENLTIILKPGFSPAEQYDKTGKQGPWTDIYALGATMYYMITGTQPDESTNRKIKDIVKDPIEIDPSIPQNISNAVMRAMAVDQHLRFPNVSEFEKALVGEIKVVTPGVYKKRKKRRRRIGISVAAVIIALITAGFSYDLHVRKSSVQLEPAEITVWYIKGGDKAKVYEELKRQFCEENEGVTVNLVGMDENEYRSKLPKALEDGTAPNLFISSGIDEGLLNGRVCELDSILREGSKLSVVTKYFVKSIENDCLFLKDYSDYFPQKTRMPVSFNVPILLTNDNETQVESVNSIEDLRSIGGEKKVVVNSDIKDRFIEMFGEEGLQYVEFADKDRLISVLSPEKSGGSCYYLTDTSEYATIQQAASAANDLVTGIAVAPGRIPVSVALEWSVKDSGSEAENAAAKMLLKLMLANKGQSILFNNSKEVGLPIDKNALKTLTGEDAHDMPYIYENRSEYYLYG